MFVLKTKRGKYLATNSKGNFVLKWHKENALQLASISYCEKLFNKGLIGQRAYIVNVNNDRVEKSLILSGSFFDRNNK